MEGRSAGTVLADPGKSILEMAPGFWRRGGGGWSTTHPIYVFYVSMYLCIYATSMYVQLLFFWKNFYLFRHCWTQLEGVRKDSEPTANVTWREGCPVL